MQIKLRPLADVHPYPGNPRLNDDAVDAVAESIRRFGFRQPIVVDAEGVVVAGHTRLRLLRGSSCSPDDPRKLTEFARHGTR